MVIDAIVFFSVLLRPAIKSIRRVVGFNSLQVKHLLAHPRAPGPDRRGGGRRIASSTPLHICRSAGRRFQDLDPFCFGGWTSPFCATETFEDFATGLFLPSAMAAARFVVFFIQYQVGDFVRLV